MPFAVRVVEPRRLDPSGHADLFNAIVQELVSPSTVPRDRFDEPTSRPASRRYDLVTFPEAFAPASCVVALAEALRGVGPTGCLHIGLRADDDPGSHLFTVPALLSFVADLGAFVDAALGDLDGFTAWLGRQSPDHMFNVGCVLAVDARSHLRVCLHPKLVRSKFEVDRLPERHMREANLLTLVTLVPTQPRFGTVTLQPIICSDALKLETDRRTPPPIPAVTLHADCLVDPPNHIDVVSVATCTPQPAGRHAGGARYRVWHSQFLETFRAAAEDPDCARHHFATIVLANYMEISDRLAGGLSGAFLPVPPGAAAGDPTVSVTCWGRPKSGSPPNNRWSDPDVDPLKNWDSRGYVVGLDPYSSDAASSARVLSFDVHRLPRETSRWRPGESLVALDVSVWEEQDGGGYISRRGASNG